MNKIPTLVLFSMITASLSQAAVVIGFTSDEGYLTAGLNGQNNWTATGGIQVNIDPAKEWVYVAGGSGQNAQYNGETYNSQDGVMSFTQEFRFNYNGTSTGDVYNIFRLDSDTSGDISRIFIHFNGTTFRLRYSTGNGFDRNLLSSANILQSDFGMNIGTDNNSDLLRLTWDLARGASASDWSYVATLENADTDTTILTWDVANGVVVRDNFHADTGIVSGFATTSILTSTNVHSFSAATVPELSTMALCMGFAVLGFVIYRGKVLRQ